MTTPAPTSPTLAEALQSIRDLMGDGPIDEVTCEVTRHGTVRIVAKRGEGSVKAKHDWRP